MKIDAKMMRSGGDIYYNQAFRDTLESHMAYFRADSKTRSLDVDPQRAIVYAGDLFGYLLECNILPQMHWLVMRVSGLFSPYEFGPSTAVLVVPDTGEVEYIRQAHNATGLVGI